MQQRHGYVRLRGCCRAFRSEKPSVSRAVKELSKSGHLVKKTLTAHFLLTETGIAACRNRFMKKHRFFTERLIAAGVDPKNSRTRRLRN